MTGALDRIGAGGVYAPTGAAPADRLAFLRPGGPPAIPMADIWADDGSPVQPGYLLLLDALPDAVGAKAIEAFLLTDPSGPRLASAPATTGLVWLRAAGGTPTLVAALETMLSPAGRPVAAADAPIMTAPGMRVFGVGKGAPIRAQGAMRVLDIGAPPQPPDGMQPGSGDFHGPGAMLDLTPATAGRIAFSALLDGTGGARERALMDVALDPVNPMASTETFTGAYWVLTGGPGGVHLEPAE